MTVNIEAFDRIKAMLMAAEDQRDRARLENEALKRELKESERRAAEWERLANEWCADYEAQRNKYEPEMVSESAPVSLKTEAARYAEKHSERPYPNTEFMALELAWLDGAYPREVKIAELEHQIRELAGKKSLKFDDMATERVALKLEIYNLKAMLETSEREFRVERDTTKRLLAENEELKTGRHERGDMWNEMVRLRNDAKRLRAALESVKLKLVAELGQWSVDVNFPEIEETLEY